MRQRILISFVLLCCMQGLLNHYVKVQGQVISQVREPSTDGLVSEPLGQVREPLLMV